MSLFRYLFSTLFVVSNLFSISGVASSNSFGGALEKPIIRHTLREVIGYDSTKMVKLVNKEINNNEEDDNAYLDNVAVVLSQTVFVQPHFSEREDALLELRGKIQREDFIVVMRRATDMLLSLAQSSQPADQASAMEALVNLVVEAKSLHTKDLKSSLQKIANAHLEISEDARKYAMEPLQNLTSPSSEAEAVLKTL